MATVSRRLIFRERGAAALLSALLGLALAVLCLVVLSGARAWAQQGDPAVLTLRRR